MDRNVLHETHGNIEVTTWMGWISLKDTVNGGIPYSAHRRISFLICMRFDLCMCSGVQACLLALSETKGAKRRVFMSKRQNAECVRPSLLAALRLSKLACAHDSRCTGFAPKNVSPETSLLWREDHDCVLQPSAVIIMSSLRD